MASRPSLQTMLEELLGSRNVYYDPPASVVMKYPAIRYARKSIQKVHADDSAYRLLNCYELTVIDPNPDSEISKKLLAIPYCSFDRSYKASNLNHDVFTIYYK